MYQVEVDIEDLSPKNYIGSTEGAFKKRYNSHVKSFRLRIYCYNTTLLINAWKIIDAQNSQYTNIRWSRVRMCKDLHGCGKVRKLRQVEKLPILNDSISIFSVK